MLFIEMNYKRSNKYWQDSYAQAGSEQIILQLPTLWSFSCLANRFLFFKIKKKALIKTF